jgi:hypothetical protein
LAEWDVNHDGESVDRPSVSAQSGKMTLQRENQAYTGNSHHDEDVAITKASRLKVVLSWTKTI